MGILGPGGLLDDALCHCVSMTTFEPHPGSARLSTPAPPPGPTEPRPGPGARLLTALTQGARLGLPLTCAGCGRWETVLCSDCLALLTAEPLEVQHAEAAGDLTVVAAAPYTGPVREMILAWKQGRRQDLDRVMARVGRRCGRWWAQRTNPTVLTDGSGLLVVPAPSGLARRAAGRLVAAALADDVARGVAHGWGEALIGAAAPGARGGGAKPPDTASPQVLSADLLRRSRGRGSGSAHQRGRSARQRRVNRADPPRVLAPVAGREVLLVDDVVTTGATLGACRRALEQAGARVLGALVLACTTTGPHTRRGLLPRGLATGDQACAHATSRPSVR